MATTITPAIGAGVLFTQQGVGTSPGYSAIDDRRADSLGLQEGVYGATDFMVVQKSSGPNLSVDITMPAGGFACVQGDSVSGQGLYTVPVHATTINEVVAAADATSPRIDSVILEVLDNVHDASGSSLARVRVLTGTPNGTATLDNRAGAPTVPGSALLLADLRVPALDTTIDNTQIRDRRKFARGAFVSIMRTGGDYTISAASGTEIDTTNIKPRLECSGAPLRVTFTGEAVGLAAGVFATASLKVDGAAAPAGDELASLEAGASAMQGNVNYAIVLTPAAGSRLLAPTAGKSGATNWTLRANATTPVFFTVEEIVRQNTANNTTTTG